MKKQSERTAEEVSCDVRMFLRAIPRGIFRDVLKEVLRENFDECVQKEALRGIAKASLGQRRADVAEDTAGPVAAVNMLIVEALFLLQKRVYIGKSSKHFALRSHLMEAQKHLREAERHTMATMGDAMLGAVYGRDAEEETG